MKKNIDVEWDYSGDKGPENWASLCDWSARGVEFPLQLPIRLTKGEETRIEGDTLSFHYQKQRSTDKKFKNTIHLVPFDQLSYIELRKERYYLTDIHFHLPSEYIINGKREDIEFRLAHMNSKKENLVVSATYQLMAREDWLYNQKNGESQNLEKHECWVNPGVFLPEQKSHLHYVGSLATPPTSGSTQWFVIDRVGKPDQKFLLPFDGQYARPNNRPIQPLNGKEVYYFEEFGQ